MSGARTALLVLMLLQVLSCAGPRLWRIDHEDALAGFREASPLVADLVDDAEAVAVFVNVEGVERGCPHEGRLLLSGGVRRRVVLRCLEEPRAPGGYTYHMLVVLQDACQVEQLEEGFLDLADFVHLAPHDDHPPQEGEPDVAPGYIVSTHRSQLLFGDQTVHQRLEPYRIDRSWGE